MAIEVKPKKNSRETAASKLDLLASIELVSGPNSRVVSHAMERKTREVSCWGPDATCIGLYASRQPHQHICLTEN